MHTIVRFIYTPETLFGQKTIKIALKLEFCIILSRLVTIVMLKELCDFALDWVIKLQNVDRLFAGFVHNIRTGTGVKKSAHELSRVSSRRFVDRVEDRSPAVIVLRLKIST